MQRHPTAQEFLDAVGPRLRANPVVNQLPLAIAATCAADPSRHGGDVRFYSGAGGVAIQTPPWAVQLADCTPEGAAELARVFAANHEPLAGVSGPDDTAEHFARAYGRPYELDTSLGVFELRAVNPLPPVAGRRVIATAEHVDLLDAWLPAFHAEATPHDPPFAPGPGARAVSTGRAHLWLTDAGEPVSYALNNRNVEGWASVGPVYTPPEARGHGYATALVADVSRYLLAAGRAGCTLFTNLANPTSNAIYERIGYRRIGRAHRFAFS